MSREIFTQSRWAETATILLPVAVREKELQPHDKSGAFYLLAVDHTGKAVETPMERPHVDAPVGRPLLFRQNASAVKAHIQRGRDLVGG